MDTSKMTEELADKYEPTLEGIIRLVEVSIPKGTDWLLRTMDGEYFANIITRDDVNLISNAERHKYVNPYKDKDPRRALYGAFISWKLKQV